MSEKEFSLTSPDGTEVHAYRWSPSSQSKIRGVLQIVHGNGEHAGWYRDMANHFNKAGYIVYANDLRGHGKTGTGKPGDLRPSKGGCESVLSDIKLLKDRIRDETRFPIFLLGYSWGYYLALRYAQEWGNTIHGLALTGVVRHHPALRYFLKMGIPLLARKIEKNDYHIPYGPVEKSFKKYETSIPDRKTEFDWLTRDEAEIREYQSDPLCQQLNVSCGFSLECAELMVQMLTPANYLKTPLDLPCYIFSGGADVVGGANAVTKLSKDFTKQGMRNVESKVYPDARHSLFHETNRKDIIEDLISWMDRQLKGQEKL